MVERMDAVVVRDYVTKDGEAKTAFTRIGTAWPTKNGWRVVLDAMPLATLNSKTNAVETSFLLMPPKGSAPSDDAPF